MKALKRSGWLVGLLLAGCGGTGALSGDYAQRYVVEYDATQNLTLFSGALLRDGRSEEIIPPATLTANGVPLNFTPANISTYPYTGFFTGRVNLPIVFTDYDNRAYENTVALTNVPTIGFQEGFVGFSRNGITNLAWAGTAVAAGETVVVRVNGNAGVVREYATSTEGATTVPVDGGEIFGIGGTRVSLSRRTTPALSEASAAGGSLTLSYSTGARTFTTF
ncbi:hypothetical protein EON81_00860 [bacterium]|nr:MAG: hypothetical protein EON81_00860 [bacterium]